MMEWKIKLYLNSEWKLHELINGADSGFYKNLYYQLHIFFVEYHEFCNIYSNKNEISDLMKSSLSTPMFPTLPWKLSDVTKYKIVSKSNFRRIKAIVNCYLPVKYGSVYYVYVMFHDMLCHEFDIQKYEFTYLRYFVFHSMEFIMHFGWKLYDFY